MIKSLKTSIQYLKGVGPKRQRLFSKLGIQTAQDLLYCFPKRYEDRSQFVAVSHLNTNAPQTILVTILGSSIRRSLKRKMFIVEVKAFDNSGKITCLWFNQPYLKKIFKKGMKVIFYGKPDIYQSHLQMNSPEYEILEEGEDLCLANESLNVVGIVPIYQLTEGLTQRYFRKIVKLCLNTFLTSLVEILPFDMRNRLNLLNLPRSLNNIHFPENLESQQEALRRLSFEEFFLHQICVILRKLTHKQKQGIAHKIDNLFLRKALDCFNFKLTSAQQRVLSEILNDMAEGKPMQRLLQGDVGSGKTIVAFLASLIAINSGYQVAFMVPTEILALQHFNNFLKLFKKIRSQLKLKVCLLTSSISKKAKANIYGKIKQGKINFVIGTHSLIEEELEFSNLGLVVIDEQHKFGVAQRSLLPKKGRNPDVLIMTATPIPRTLCLTIYGDLDVSLINELPPGRQTIKTLQFNEDKRGQAYDFVKQQINLGRQAYIVYPIIEESNLVELKAAKQMFEELRKNEFNQYKLGLIHGRIKKSEAEAIMNDFAQGKINLLVATSILEVGVDVANASCMVIEQAERFGLSQLHQLRGRIGRGIYASYCLLITEPKTPEAQSRLKAITELNDGFKIAEEDLRIRGPGEFFGKRQHGLSELKIANPLTQIHLLKLAREQAKRLLLADPGLLLRQNMPIKQYLKERYANIEELMQAG